MAERALYLPGSYYHGIEYTTLHLSFSTRSEDSSLSSLSFPAVVVVAQVELSVLDISRVGVVLVKVSLGSGKDLGSYINFLGDSPIKR